MSIAPSRSAFLPTTFFDPQPMKEGRNIVVTPNSPDFELAPEGSAKCVIVEYEWSKLSAADTTAALLQPGVVNRVFLQTDPLNATIQAALFSDESKGRMLYQVVALSEFSAEIPVRGSSPTVERMRTAARSKFVFGLRGSLAKLASPPAFEQMEPHTWDSKKVEVTPLPVGNGGGGTGDGMRTGDSPVRQVSNPAISSSGFSFWSLPASVAYFSSKWDTLRYQDAKLEPPYVLQLPAVLDFDFAMSFSSDSVLETYLGMTKTELQKIAIVV